MRVLELKIKLRVLRLRASRLGALSLSWALWPLELLSFQIGSSLAFLIAHGLFLPLRRARLHLQRKAQAQAREMAEDLKVLHRVRTQTLQNERLTYILSKSSTGASDPELPGGGEGQWPAST